MVTEVVEQKPEEQQLQVEKGLKNHFLVVKRIYIECDICVSLIQCQGADRD